MKRTVAVLTGAMLDLWVARAEGRNAKILAPIAYFSAELPTNTDEMVCYAEEKEHPGHFTPFCPSTDWALAGPIIKRERISLDGGAIFNSGGWFARTTPRPMTANHVPQTYRQHSDDPLLAAMRAYVNTRFGNEVPDLELAV